MSELDDILAQLTERQREFVSKRAELGSDKAAADAMGMHRHTAYRWRKQGLPIERAVELITTGNVQAAIDGIEEARRILREAAPQAAQTLIDQLKKRDAVRAATAILNRAGLPEETHINAKVESAGVMIVLDDPETQV